ncbi:MAG: glycosyltransferase 87 family protein [Terracidiphilus sp.]
MKNEHDLSVLSIAAPCALAVIFTVLFLSALPVNRDLAAKRDFITYWATGQQLVHHGNPYDPAAVSRIEWDAGFQGGASYYMRNAPWALPLALPLGYVGAQAAALPWSLVMLGLLFASARMLWKVFRQGGARLDWIGYCFPPALFCVILGQTSILLLFGLAVFLRLHKSYPFVAGAALWFCTLKPHLFLPFVLVLLVWIVVSRSYRILLGGLAAFAAGALLTTSIDPAAWSQYLYYMRTSVVTQEFTPCLGDVLRDSIRPSAEWLAFVPCIVACVWALAWFWPRRRSWNWLENGNLLMLVSLLVAPFGWIFDQTLAIPAILFAVSRKPSRIWMYALALIYLLIEFQIGFHVELHSRAFLWIAPVWIVWFLFARASARKTVAPVVAA